MSIWKTLNKGEKSLNDSGVQKQQPGTSSDMSVDQYIAKIYGESSTPDHQTSSLEQELRNIQFQQRRSASDTSFNIVEYWYKKKLVDPRLWDIARVVYTAASTQVSVERDNSHFNMVFTPHRYNIGEENLTNVLQVKLNDGIIDQAIANTLCSSDDL